MGTQATHQRRTGTWAARRLAGLVAAAAVCLVLAPGTAAAAPTNPSDAEIAQAQQVKATAAEQVGALSAALADAQAQADAAPAPAGSAPGALPGKHADHEAAP